MTTHVAFLFPGQGSQAVGMGADISASSAAARRVFAEVDEALDIPLSALCFAGPEESLRQTINAQPAIMTVSLAVLAALQESLSPQRFSWSFPLAPDYTAGHSVGEYAALVAAGVLDLKSAARLVRERGRLMHVEGTRCPGGMAAVIGLEAEQVQAICQEATQRMQALASGGERHVGWGQVVVANYNAPGQLVISGEQQALDLASELARARGAKRVIPLGVSGAFHSPVMQPATVGLAQAIAASPLQNAAIPLISNITAQPLSAVEALRTELSQQVATSVQWIKSIDYMVSRGTNLFLEIGPGQVLSGMVKRIAKGVQTLSVGSVADIEKATVLLREMGVLHDV